MMQNDTPEQHKKLPRLYVPFGGFIDGRALPLSEDQAHYLRNVMRLNAGDGLRVFNGQDGEYLARLDMPSKKSAVAVLQEKIRAQQAPGDIRVLASPLKNEPFAWMAEKASELGASSFQPVLCDHTAVRRANEERLGAIATEAAEQCERLDVMQVAPLKPLDDVLAGWDAACPVYFCLERADALPVAQAFQSHAKGKPLALLVGPEGGFSAREAQLAGKYPFLRPISLGPRILRAETALLAALSVAQAVSGDWR